MTRRALACLLLTTTHLTAALSLSAAQPPLDNPVAAYYSGDEGYPAWTDRVRWSNEIDMSRYERGDNDFQRFENARDELAAQGGGVLYYPAGTYDFSKGPMDGSDGRGLMLKGGVVIRGDAPNGRPSALRDGKLGLRTKFVFGFRKVGGGRIPRDWGLIGLMPEAGQGLHQIDNVGVCWVHCVGATVYFGPEVSWGKRWGDGAWKRVADAVNGNWRQRVPNGTHPIAPYAAGGGKYVGVGSGRLVFGCVFEDAAVDAGNLNWGHHPQRFCSRVGVYGDRVFVANNVIPKSTSVFKLGGQLYDYGKTIGVDINKAMLGVVRDEGRCPGYFAEGIVCRDNWVYNHGNKGYEIAGRWVTIQNCRNQRDYLREGSSKAYGIGGWALTLEGRERAKQTSDNMSRAFDLGGGPLWIDGCSMNNTGSEPGNDGEGILCQRHGGTEIYSWAITHNTHDQAGGEPGYFGGYDVHCYGLLISWNKTPGWVGNAKAGRQYDCTFLPNQCSSVNVADFGEYKGKVGGKHTGTSGVADVLTESPKGRPSPPTAARATVHEADAVRITWRDTSDSELGFRVERQVDGGRWHTIAYRPRQSEGHDKNPAQWIDFLAPRERELRYRVIACDVQDSDAAASRPTETLILP